MAAQDLKKRLSDLERRIGQRTSEYRSTGRFSDTHAALVENIRQRQAALQQKVDQAAGRHANWGLVEAELNRDFQSLYDDLIRLEERLDAETGKRL